MQKTQDFCGFPPCNTERKLKLCVTKEVTKNRRYINGLFKSNTVTSVTPKNNTWKGIERLRAYLCYGCYDVTYIYYILIFVVVVRGLSEFRAVTFGVTSALHFWGRCYGWNLYRRALFPNPARVSRRVKLPSGTVLAGGRLSRQPDSQERREGGV